MVLLSDWQAFVLAVRDMYAHSPNTTRCMIKYRRESGELKLKVTDNVTCLKYRASSTADLKNIDKFARMFLQWTLIKAVSSASHLPLNLLPGSGRDSSSSSSSSSHQGPRGSEPPKKSRRRKRGD